MNAQTHEITGSLIAIGGTDRSGSLEAQPMFGSKRLSNQFISAIEDSRSAKILGKSVACLLVTNRRKRVHRLHFRTKVSARSRFLETSVTMRTIGRSYKGGEAMEMQPTRS
ncbi:hypothetical protein SLE2022_291720 [Rubroshorea leprosula]